MRFAPIDRAALPNTAKQNIQPRARLHRHSLNRTEKTMT
ncbi:hypothetical protein GLA29479_5000 [Lysobacter antibioticus]|nr:hypothetical protein GLA29479_5000 [Lysobacter antibioticus]